MRKHLPLFINICIGVVPLITLAYAFWYCTSDYRSLSEWYQQLNPDFYRAETWRSFFTETTKSQGNLWCVAAVIAASVGTFIAIKIPQPVFPPFQIHKKSILIYSGIALGGFILWLIAMRHSLYASDEVFSALNFASLPAFQRISYYILPNNHLLFNFINGFFNGFDDLVQTGRLISMVCYLGVLGSTWYFLKKWTDNNWLKVAILLLVSVQLPIWGFSAQARGYELTLLCCVLSFISFWCYWAEKKRYFLTIHFISIAAGMLTLPTFLYWWIGLLIAATIIQIDNRQFDKSYFRAMLLCFCFTLVLFLPVLSFSGLSAFTENGYVKGGNETAWHFLAHLNATGYFNGLFSEWFYTGNAWIGIICLSMPLFLFLYHKNNKRNFTTGITYLSIIIAFVIVSVMMRKFPFNRNLIAHAYIISLFLTIGLTTVLRSKAMQILYIILLLIGSGYSISSNYKRKADALYYYNIRENFDHLNACKIQFEPNKTIYLDNESFYWWYILKDSPSDKAGNIELNRPAFNLQDYCIMPQDSLPPVSDTLIYRRMARCGEYDVFEKLGRP